jgi:thiol-disulfide isomerase/thioredoxin
MRNLVKTSTLLLLMSLAACCASFAKVIIRGKIHNYDGKSIVYYHPVVEGIYTPYGKEIQPAANGSFHIEFEAEGYGSARISYQQVVYRFFHDSNSQIYVEIREKEKKPRKRIPGERIFLKADSVKQATTIRISGDYEAINRFYNRNLRSSYFTTSMVDGNYYSWLICNAATPASALAILDSLSQREVQQINQLPWHISPENPDADKKQAEIRNFLVNEVRAFYGAVFLNGMFLKRKQQILAQKLDSTAQPNLYNRSWEQLVEKMSDEVKQHIEPLPNSPDYLDLMESLPHALSSYRQYSFPQNPTTPLDQVVLDRLFNYDTTLFRDEKSRFAYELKGLHLYLNDQLFYSPALLHAVYDLQAKHPHSANLDFYKPQIEKLKKSLVAAQRSFDDGTIIKGRYNSFAQLLKRFEGKTVLIDIWATWCHPCVEEFNHKASIAPFIKSGALEVLYISIDKPQWEDRWKQSIKINQLEGNHFRADAIFIEDMWKAIGDDTGLIPRYVLIDKQGKIFKSTAARPSAGDALIKQVESLIAGTE